ncbi:MAG: minichromosome maintenance protein MCM [Clostridia bacterium]|nr:minichromosome maintenance protein MCM [Clostridia bacterium]
MPPKTRLDEITDFLEEYYKSEILNLLNGTSKELVIDFQLLERKNPTLADGIVNNYSSNLNIFYKVVKENLNTNNSDLGNLTIGFKNLDKTPLRNLLSNKLNQMVETEAVIKSLGEIKAKLVKPTYKCNSCYFKKKESEVTKCPDCGGKTFTVVKEESTYQDTRELILEEPTDTLKTTKRRRIIAEADKNLIYKIDIGQTANITGLLTIKENTNKNDTETERFKLEINHIEPKEDTEIKLTPENIKYIKEIAQDPNILKRIIHSLAPNLIIDKQIKLGILCAIVKGITTKSETDDERKEINILLVTDPSMGKTKFGNTIIKLPAKGISVNGANSSGVGLVGAVVKDDLTNKFMLEIGAMPLANGGILLIDEFDKLPVEETKKLLKLIEEGKDTIAKAGLKEDITAKTGVIALANPKYGRYDGYKSLKEQVDVYPPILSRFDLIFLLHDEVDNEKDGKIADAILNRYITDTENANKTELLNMDTLRKYLNYASTLEPELTEEARANLKEYYVNTRNANKTDTEDEDKEQVITIDTRALQSIIRISGAIAKLQLKETITAGDIELAKEIKKVSMQSVGLDPITGKIDIDRITGNYDNADRRNKNLILQTIKDTLEDIESDYIEKSYITCVMTDEKGMGKTTYYNTFNKLKQGGDIVEKGNRIYMK